MSFRFNSVQCISIHVSMKNPGFICQFIVQLMFQFMFQLLFYSFRIHDNSFHFIPSFVRSFASCIYAIYAFLRSVNACIPFLSFHSIHSIPLHSIPFHSIPFRSFIPFIAFHSIPFHSFIHSFHSLSLSLCLRKYCSAND